MTFFFINVASQANFRSASAWKFAFIPTPRRVADWRWKDSDLERVTISMSDEFAAELAAFMNDNRYGNRSEALRHLARLGLERFRIDRDVAGPRIATLSYIYDHHARELPKRLTEAHQTHHRLQVATMHVHLDPDSCLEVAVLRGDAGAVRDFSKAVIAERGVTHGHLSFAPIATRASGHVQGAVARPHRHVHPA